MNINLHTYDIQNIMMCVMFSNLSTMSEEDRARYVDMLTNLNQMCNENNNHTVTVTIK